ncbi:GatB/GatE catalytic domain-containing protein [Jimgerdemannia flammicorona]|uniref:GatB/GatE catalytic domain-containing protein n=1 Tax=Jimgerdemannia flammicorona TaxID=994334 RepID=A0A433QYX2_9FUNG|nr:GatB/GatE catalytic domain-containing protein [Jimgerdemannia flammicorona]
MHAIHLSRLGRVALHTSSVRGARAVNNAPRALVNGKWEAVVGLEVHAQIDSRTKLFSGKWAYKCVVGNYATKDVNSLVSLVSVFALSIPDIVQRACEHQCVRYRRSVPRRVASECHGRSIRRSTCVDLAVMTALALKADVHLRSSFDRKHYFYPDLPQGYQITQHYEPISTGGLIALTELDGVSYPLEVRVEQLQLEQDTGKSLYDMVPGITLVDLNRAGTGLMEIVTRPDMRCIVVRGGIGGEEDAGTAAVCWIVEWEYGRGGCAFGSMRCDVNVSVHEVDTPFGTRCELKNLNSVRFLTMAIDAEVRRQIEVLEQGGTVMQETRGYDVVAGKTFRLRSKETAPDYRWIQRLFTLSLFAGNENLSEIVSARLRAGKIGKDVLAVMIDGDVRPAAEIVEEKGWHVVGDAAELRKVCEDLVANNKDKVSRCTFFTSAGLVHPCARCLTSFRKPRLIR